MLMKEKMEIFLTLDVNKSTLNFNRLKCRLKSVPAADIATQTFIIQEVAEIIKDSN